MKRSFERSPERRRVVLVGRPPPKPLRGFDSPGGGVIQSATHVAFHLLGE